MAARILFITSGRIGDAVLSTGILNRLIDENPGAQVMVACGPAATSLFAALPGLERTHAMVKKPRAGHWIDLWHACSRRRWDIVVDLRASLFAWTVRAARRHVIPTDNRMVHRVRHFAEAMGYDPPPAPHIWLDESHRLQASLRMAPGAPIIAVAPTANWAGKIWPAARFISALDQLTGASGLWPAARLALFGAPSERPLAQPLFAAFGDRVIDGFASTDLLTVQAMLERSQFFIGNDSGLMHMAAAAGLPTVGLFGPSLDQRYAPWGSVTTAVRGASYDQILSRPGYDHRSGACYMTDLGVAAVVDAAQALWQRHLAQSIS